MLNFNPEKLIHEWWSPSSPLPIECEEWMEESPAELALFWEKFSPFIKKAGASLTKA